MQASHNSKPQRAPHFATILHALRYWATEKPQAIFSTFCGENEESVTISYQALDRQSQKIATYLKQQGLVNGDRVLISLPQGLEFLSSFLGVLKAGGIAVPTGQNSPALNEIRKDCTAKFSLTLNQHLSSSFFNQNIDVDQILKNEKDSEPKKVESIHILSPSDASLIQYHFKKTSRLKGLVFTHIHMMSCIAALKNKLHTENEDTLLSWLPLHGNVGLIGCFLYSLYTGSHFVLMRPQDFMKDPNRWLIEISKNKATISMAPMAAYSLCSRKDFKFTTKDFDLSTWKKALCFGPTISLPRIKNFFFKFEKKGLLPQAFIACYGLSENGLAATVSSFRSDEWLSLRDISRGTPLLDQEVRILGPDGKFLGERKTGEIVLRTHSAAINYFNGSKFPKDLYLDRWLKTGDEGYLNNSELFLMKSKKIYPYPSKTLLARRIMSYIMTGPILSVMSSLCSLKTFIYSLIQQKKLS
ncbi:MAG: AMP-binding protein [Deltaproteobacteria bacterium]|nr:AMP-binding protein [Deltaproteobacteria bacterium]